MLFVFVREVRLMIGMGTSLPRRFYDTFSHQFTDLDDVRLHHVDGPAAGEAVVLLGDGHWSPEENPDFLLTRPNEFLARTR